MVTVSKAERFEKTIIFSKPSTPRRDRHAVLRRSVFNEKPSHKKELSARNEFTINFLNILGMR